MTDAVFLSASVPDPKRSLKYAHSADTVAITAAVSALVHVLLGRRLLVWGGHPAITPMIWEVAEGLGVEYGRWVTLYQSRYFQDEFPEDNNKFQNVIYVDAVNENRDLSLRTMRERMFTDRKFTAAVFIGGMEGVLEEFLQFRKLNPKANLVPVLSTGGAVLDIAKQLVNLSPDLEVDMDYVSLFHRHLNIPVQELRYKTPAEQPVSLEKRYWPPKQG